MNNSRNALSLMVRCSRSVDLFHLHRTLVVEVTNQHKIEKNFLQVNYECELRVCQNPVCSEVFLFIKTINDENDVYQT